MILCLYKGGFTMSNFNEEMVKELEDFGFGCRIVSISKKDKGTLEDYAKLEADIFVKTEENRIMMEQSIINAKDGLPVGQIRNAKLLVKKL